MRLSGGTRRQRFRNVREEMMSRKLDSGSEMGISLLSREKQLSETV
jgi:hypothetical protein